MSSKSPALEIQCQMRLDSTKEIVLLNNHISYPTKGAVCIRNFIHVGFLHACFVYDQIVNYVLSQIFTLIDQPCQKEATILLFMLVRLQDCNQPFPFRIDQMNFRLDEHLYIWHPISIIRNTLLQ